VNQLKIPFTPNFIHDRFEEMVFHIHEVANGGVSFNIPLWSKIMFKNVMDDEKIYDMMWDEIEKNTPYITSLGDMVDVKDGKIRINGIRPNLSIIY
jgi:hypothetical protein